MSISRREFLETAAAGSLAAGSVMADGGAGMPTRVLGKTGARVSILAMGGGSRFLQYEEDQAAEAVHKALDLGITYIDTCDDYGKDHLSERRIGAAIKGRRDRIFLATKVTTRVPEDVPRVVELSLKCLQVDHVDLLHIHS
ncbi:MAG: aldo/keto reductase, partial [Bryobacteraceae bacterium]